MLNNHPLRKATQSFSDYHHRIQGKSLPFWVP